MGYFLNRTKTCGVFHAPDRLNGTKHNPLTKRASSVALNAQSSATELGRDPGMHRNIVSAPFAFSAAESSRNNPRPLENSMPSTNDFHILCRHNISFQTVRLIPLKDL